MFNVAYMALTIVVYTRVMKMCWGKGGYEF